MSSNVKYLTFYENWRKNKKWCTPEEWYELEDIILQLRFDGIDTDPDTIENEKIAMIWNNIRPSILKSNRDKRYNDSKKSKQSSNILQDTVGDEFNIPQVTNNIPSNEENENKPILDTQITQDDNQYQPEVENSLNSLKMGNNEIVEDDTYMEQKPVVKIAANNQNSDIERLQNIINTDDDFYRVYNNCIKAVVEYKLSAGDSVKANTKEMAMQKLKDLYHSYQIPYNKETHNMFLDDVEYSIINKNNDVA